MTCAVAATGINRNSYNALFRKQILRLKPQAVGMAVAYVSGAGFKLVKKILDDGNVNEVRLVADTKDCVTHPNALKSTRDGGWQVRVVDSLAGTFHPKFYVGGTSFSAGGAMTDLSLAITGSA